jgi:hypothetical protein
VGRKLRLAKPIDTEEATEQTPEEEAFVEQARGYADARWVERQAEELRKARGRDLLPLMQQVERDEYAFDFDDQQRAVVRVKTRVDTTIHEAQLRTKLGAPAFNKLTTPKLDETKIEAAIQAGELDANLVASCSQTTETPYLEVRYVAKKRKRAPKKKAS